VGTMTIGQQGWQPLLEDPLSQRDFNKPRSARRMRMGYRLPDFRPVSLAISRP
jgi:hypothetical protein